MATLTATGPVAEQLTEEEIEALEDAEDLAIAKERMANSVPSERISMEQARAHFAARAKR